VLHDASVERELNARHYVLLRADWTRYDPEITRQLASVSRSGVPTYVIYPSAPGGRVQVLPELLSRSAVLTGPFSTRKLARFLPQRAVIDLSFNLLQRSCYDAQSIPFRCLSDRLL
jgi:hypothetical protein